MTTRRTDQFIAWAQLALAQYPLREHTLRFLGHSDNLTFRVEEPGGAVYLLRLHRPVLSYWEGIRQLPEAIGSELAWLEALAWEGGFPVQHPIHTLSGDMVATITNEDGENIPCTLLTWLEGEHFSAASPGAQAQVEDFGRLVARLHQFSTHWAPPAGFFRPQYNLDHFRRIFAHLMRGVNLGVFSEDIYRKLRATTRAILAEIEALPDDPEYWGMIHADLHVGNFLVSTRLGGDCKSDIIPIDFSFCGNGHYLFDLSVCLSGGLKSSLAPAFVNGYRSVRPLPESSFRAIDAYVLSGILTYMAYQIDNPAETAWLQRRVPEITQNECTRFLNGERVLSSL